MLSTRPLFPLGRTIVTYGAHRLMLDQVADDEQKARQALVSLLDRHVRGDWQEMSESDQALNRDAIEGGDRILSGYWVNTSEGRERVFVITEDDRTATTILLAEEY